jgi:hypothetical protein
MFGSADKSIRSSFSKRFGYCADEMQLGTDSSGFAFVLGQNTRVGEYPRLWLMEPRVFWSKACSICIFLESFRTYICATIWQQSGNLCPFTKGQAERVWLQQDAIPVPEF